jgi:hypothetical protein
MKRHLFYTFLGIFAATAIITLLGIMGVLQIREGYLTSLVATLLIESAGAVIALFRGAEFFTESPPDASNQNHPTAVPVTHMPQESVRKMDDYHGANIGGEWLSFNGDPTISTSHQDGDAVIEQTGHDISMRLKLTRNRHGNAINRKFIYAGQFWEGQLVLTFHDEDARGYIIGAIVLRLTSDLKRLIGKTTYFHHSTNAVVSEDFCLQRP